MSISALPHMRACVFACVCGVFMRTFSTIRQTISLLIFAINCITLCCKKEDGRRESSVEKFKCMNRRLEKYVCVNKKVFIELNNVGMKFTAENGLKRNRSIWRVWFVVK